jgi:hypothetical protein
MAVSQLTKQERVVSDVRMLGCQKMIDMIDMIDMNDGRRKEERGKKREH